LQEAHLHFFAPPESVAESNGVKEESEASSAPPSAEPKEEEEEESDPFDPTRELQECMHAVRMARLSSNNDPLAGAQDWLAMLLAEESGNGTEARQATTTSVRSAPTEDPSNFARGLLDAFGSVVAGIAGGAAALVTYPVGDPGGGSSRGETLKMAQASTPPCARRRVSWLVSPGTDGGTVGRGEEGGCWQETAGSTESGMVGPRAHASNPVLEVAGRVEDKSAEAVAVDHHQHHAAGAVAPEAMLGAAEAAEAVAVLALAAVTLETTENDTDDLSDDAEYVDVD